MMLIGPREISDEKNGGGKRDQEKQN